MPAKPMSQPISRRYPNRAAIVRSDPIESLESRQLLAAPPNVTGVIADNRGEVLITFSRAVNGVNNSSVRLFTSGPDGVLGTADDVRKTDIVVRYDQSRNRLTIRGNTDINAVYRIRLEDTITGASDGKRLDGEFSGTFPTGNGRSEGDFNFLTRRDRSDTPVLRMSTVLGLITLRMRADVAPRHVSNFLDYANSGRYDNIFFTRSVEDFVIQAGSAQITGDGLEPSDVTAPSAFDPIADENDVPGALSNTVGTLSSAKSGPNTATNQFFLNNGNNSDLDSPTRPDGGFTVFGVATNQTTLNTIDAINSLTTAILNNSFNQQGVLAPIAGTGLSDVPLIDQAGLTLQTQQIGTDSEGRPVQGQVVTAGLVPSSQLAVIRRTAVQMKVFIAS